MLDITTLTKRYGTGTLALDHVSLSVAPGEIVAIVGGSGCGKSTLLRLIAGLESPTVGGVHLNGSTIEAPRPEVGLVFQEPRLMPWLTITENVAFGLSHLPKAEQARLAGEALERVGIAQFAGAWPRELSGGMAQRAALARALVMRPEVLLLDEPFSALDAFTRHDLQDHLLELWGWYQPTMVLVTHDIEEALFLADRVVVMQPRPGRVRCEVRPGLKRPRERTGLDFQRLKQHLLGELDRSFQHDGDESNPAAAI